MVSPGLSWRGQNCGGQTVITAVPEAHMALVILTGLDLLTLEQVACRHVDPAGNCLHQLKRLRTPGSCHFFCAVMVKFGPSAFKIRANGGERAAAVSWRVREGWRAAGA